MTHCSLSTKKQVHSRLGAIAFTRNARARRITVHIQADGLRVTLPPGVTEREALRFVGEHEEEIAQKQAGLQVRRQAKLLLPGETPALHTRTFDVRVVVEERANIFFRLEEGTLSVYCPEGTDLTAPALQRKLWNGVAYFLRQEAHRVLPLRLHELATAHGFDYRGVKIQPSRTRWGSCSARRDINLSYYLMLVPPHLADYVMLHELCHTREMNHGARFWQLMDQVTGGRAKALRTELKAYTQALPVP